MFGTIGYCFLVVELELLELNIQVVVGFVLEILKSLLAGLIILEDHVSTGLW